MGSAVATLAAYGIAVAWPFLSLAFRVAALVTLAVLVFTLALSARAGLGAWPRHPWWPYVVAAAAPGALGLVILGAMATPSLPVQVPPLPEPFGEHIVAALVAIAVAAALGGILGRAIPAALFAGPALLGVVAAVALATRIFRTPGECAVECQSALLLTFLAFLACFASLLSLLAASPDLRR